MVIDIHKIIFYYYPNKAIKTSILVALLFSFFCEIKRNRFYEKKSLIITTATALFLSLAHISHAQNSQIMTEL